MKRRRLPKRALQPRCDRLMFSIVTGRERKWIRDSLLLNYGKTASGEQNEHGDHGIYMELS